MYNPLKFLNAFISSLVNKFVLFNLYNLISNLYSEQIRKKDIVVKQNPKFVIVEFLVGINEYFDGIIVTHNRYLKSGISFINNGELASGKMIYCKSLSCLKHILKYIFSRSLVMEYRPDYNLKWEENEILSIIENFEEDENEISFVEKIYDTIYKKYKAVQNYFGTISNK